MTPTPDAGRGPVILAPADTAAHRFLATVEDAADREWPERCSERGPSLVSVTNVRGQPGWHRVHVSIEVYAPDGDQ